MKEVDDRYLVEIDILQQLNCQAHSQVTSARLAECYGVSVDDEAALTAICEQIMEAIKPHFPSVGFEFERGYVRFANTAKRPAK